MKKYIVSVRTSVIEYYEVEAASADDAMQTWQEGRFLHTDDANLDAVPLRAEERGEEP